MLKLWRSTTQLADGTLGHVCTSFKLNGAEIIDESSPIEAAAKVFYSRGCGSHDVEFTIVSTHATAAAAMQFAVGRRAAIAGRADLSIAVDAFAAVLANAVWPDVQPEPQGIICKCTYKVRGGLWTVTAAVADDETPVEEPNVREDFSPSAAATVTAGFTAGQHNYFSDIAVGAGAGTFTWTLKLASASRTAGDNAQLTIRMPASANPTIQITDDDDTVLHTISPDAATARVYFVTLNFRSSTSLFQRMSFGQSTE